MNNRLTITEFPFKTSGEIVLNIPTDAKLLGLRAAKPGNAAVWALVPKNAEATPRNFRLLAAGETIDGQIDTDFRYVGLIAVDGVVKHFFEIVRTPVAA